MEGEMKSVRGCLVSTGGYKSFVEWVKLDRVEGCSSFVWKQADEGLYVGHDSFSWDGWVGSPWVEGEHFAQVVHTMSLYIA